MSVTRRDLRRDIASAMHDLLTVTAESGSNNMLVDPVELTDYDNTYAGAQAICVSATHPGNVGKIVRIVASNRLGNSISFTPALPDPVEPGDVFDVHNLRGKGFRVHDYNEKIRTVVQRHAKASLNRVDSDPVVFDVASPFIDIPEDWMSIHGVTIHVAGTNQTFEVHAGRYEGARGWRVDSTNRRVEISGSDAGAAHGQEVVLHGMVPHGVVANDDDLIYLNTEFLGKTIQSELAARRGEVNWNQWAVEWARMAAGLRPGNLPSWPPNTIMLERR